MYTKNDNVLLTGGSGFLGSVIIESFSKQGLAVRDLSDLYEKRVDITQPFTLNCDRTYNTVIHLAGRAHRNPISKEDREEFWKVNLGGTKHLCEALENSSGLPASFVFISSVSVYGLDEGENIDEECQLNGISDYARSKIESEFWLQEWSKRNGIKLLIFRLPLIAGSNPPGNLRAMIEGIQTGRYFRIGKGDARKSIVLASDVAEIIMKSNNKEGTYNLTDGYHPSFRELERLICGQLHRKMPHSIPLWLAKAAARMGDLFGNDLPINSHRLSKIISTLTFNDEKARCELDWDPKRVLEGFKIF